MNSNAMEIDAQLCQLLDSLSLQGQRRKATFASEEQAAPAPPAPAPAPPADDAAMSDSSDSEDSTYQASPSQSAASGSCCGCAYLQAVCAQIREGAYATTSGDFLETIFTHREALLAFPQGHRACAAGFTELARDLETRAQRAATVEGGGYQWRPDWDGDHEAVVAFRHEAWVIANVL
ncbi:hypothetical protein GSI_04164 [Ganoderma sinense ZZ0214-1]|uniref:Uncharacterized protein n=1 Tax=Ganoderma sinense ZZ0214-1 TaxID=1077348 RepID=A0A2G8SIF6_9APHY|nr:hypothetical protein GSI_04164 [Ganoderma sinense ZZ0214-1]